MSKFHYVLEKINDAPFLGDPFRHIYVEDLFTPEDFAEIVASHEVNVPRVEDDVELFLALHKRNFKEIKFPGTTTDVLQYIHWHKHQKKQQKVNGDTCEGFGVTLRLQETSEGSILRELSDFFGSLEFWNAVSQKFGLKFDATTADVGLQKYLDGYEISPHPDIRKKALTFMINLNPAAESEKIAYHTDYLSFKPERDYIREYWTNTPKMDRCWVPWDWCTSHKHQTKNNSIVLFSPANDTLHAVKASYDHLTTQRTQYYGNLWYKNVHVDTKKQPSWQALDKLRATLGRREPSFA
jgi:hypothetical protein